VDWLTFPRYDSPSVFCRLLDDEGGHWSISVPGAESIRRRYLEGTSVGWWQVADQALTSFL
jgi:GH15 family glucan-1,4-alpha-glucosidase